MYPSVYSIYTIYRYIDHIHTVHNTDLFLLYIAYTLYTGIYTICTLSTALTCLSCIWHIHCSRYLFHALKNTANQRPGLPLHILRYATGNIPLYFLVIPCAQQFTGVHLRTSQKPAPKPFNSCEPLRTFPIRSGNRFQRFPNTSEDFRRFSENLKKS